MFPVGLAAQRLTGFSVLSLGDFLQSCGFQCIHVLQLPDVRPCLRLALSTRLLYLTMPLRSSGHLNPNQPQTDLLPSPQVLAPSSLCQPLLSR